LQVCDQIGELLNGQAAKVRHETLLADAGMGNFRLRNSPLSLTGGPDRAGMSLAKPGTTYASGRRIDSTRYAAALSNPRSRARLRARRPMSSRLGP